MKTNLLIIAVTFFCSSVFSQTDTLKTKPKGITHILEAVTVTTNKSKSIKQQPVNVSIVDAKPFYDTFFESVCCFYPFREFYHSLFLAYGNPFLGIIWR